MQCHKTDKYGCDENRSGKITNKKHATNKKRFIFVVLKVKNINQ
jgi:hypothetical protein